MNNFMSIFFKIVEVEVKELELLTVIGFLACCSEQEIKNKEDSKRQFLRVI